MKQAELEIIRRLVSIPFWRPCSPRDFSALGDSQVFCGKFASLFLRKRGVQAILEILLFLALTNTRRLFQPIICPRFWSESVLGLFSVFTSFDVEFVQERLYFIAVNFIYIIALFLQMHSCLGHKLCTWGWR